MSDIQGTFEFSGHTILEMNGSELTLVNYPEFQISRLLAHSIAHVSLFTFFFYLKGEFFMALYGVRFVLHATLTIVFSLLVVLAIHFRTEKLVLLKNNAKIKYVIFGLPFTVATQKIDTLKSHDCGNQTKLVLGSNTFFALHVTKQDATSILEWLNKDYVCFKSCA
jgi:hypothetical protein